MSYSSFLVVGNPGLILSTTPGARLSIVPRYHFTTHALLGKHIEELKPTTVVLTGDLILRQLILSVNVTRALQVHSRASRHVMKKSESSWGRRPRYLDIRYWGRLRTTQGHGLLITEDWKEIRLARLARRPFRNRYHTTTNSCTFWGLPLISRVSPTLFCWTTTVEGFISVQATGTSKLCSDERNYKTKWAAKLHKYRRAYDCLLCWVHRHMQWSQVRAGFETTRCRNVESGFSQTWYADMQEIGPLQHPFVPVWDQNWLASFGNVSEHFRPFYLCPFSLRACFADVCSSDSRPLEVCLHIWSVFQTSPYDVVLQLSWCRQSWPHP